MSANLLEGDTVLVTGAASGIGRGIALQLAYEGATVMLSDSNTTGGQQTSDQLRDEGHDADFIGADLSTKEGPGELFRKASERLGGVSILVHSASPPRQLTAWPRVKGIPPPPAPRKRAT